MCYITSIFLVSTTLLAVTSTPVTLSKQWTYSYDAESYVHNSACNKHRAQWALSGQVIAQKFENYAIFKFHDLKISTYNGVIDEVPKVDIPEDARILMEPFIYNYPKAEIQVNADEPKWSINMKRSLASILHFDMDAINSKIVVPEETMYGKCNVTYKIVDESNNKLRVDKVVDVAQCGGEIESHFTGNKVFAGCSGLNHKQVSRNTTRTYYIDDKDKPHIRNRIESTADIMFHVTPLDDHKQMIHQHQELNLQYFGDIKDKLDVSKSTLVKGIKYEHGTGPMEGRVAKKEWTTAELSVKMIEKLKYLSEEISKREVDNSWMLSGNMDDLWYTMADQTFLSLTDTFNEVKFDYNLKRAFISVLPYIGSNESLKFITMLISSDHLDVQQLMKTLAVFPKYVHHHTEERLKNMQFLMNLRQESRMVKNSGILSFASLVRETYNDDKISKGLFDEHVHKYTKLFKESKDYERRMVYLVGLQNLEVDLDVLLPIIKDEEESQHIRALAIQIALPKLKSSEDKFEDVFLPMLKSETLSLELRAAALNVLIETNRDTKDFQTVYEYLKEESEADVNMMHLYHYLFSSLASYAEDTKCKHSLKQLSSEYLPKLEEPSNAGDFWTTDNFRLGFTNNGPDYGAHMQMRKIVNPNTKTIETIEFTFDQFALGIQRKVSVHLKLHGLLDQIFKSTFASSSFSKVDDFMQYLKKAKSNQKIHHNVHIEIIISIDDKAVLARHFDRNSFNSKNYKLVAEEVLTLLLKGTTELYYPVMYYLHVPSDMGTDLTFNLDEERLAYQSLENLELLGDMTDTDYHIETRGFLVVTKSAELYDPISVLRHGAMQIQYRNVIAGVTFNFTEEDEYTYLQFENDKLIFKSRSDISLLTYVDNATLINDFCSDCGEYTIYQNDKSRTISTTELPLLSHTVDFAINNTDASDNRLSYQKIVTDAIKDTIGNYEVAPATGLIFTYISSQSHEMYIPQWISAIITTEIRPSFKEPTKTMIHLLPYFEDLEDSNQVMSGSDAVASLALKVMSIKENKLLRMVNVSVGFREEPGLVNQSYTLDVQFMNGNPYTKMCMNLDFEGVPQRADLYSMVAADPTKARLGVKLSLSDTIIDKCEAPIIAINLGGEFSVTDEQTELASKALESPFKECKEDSAGLKYTAPTASCRSAAVEMNRYRNYKLTATFELDKDNLIKLNDLYEGSAKYVSELSTFPSPLKLTLDVPISENKGILQANSSVDSINEYIYLWAPVHKYPYIDKNLLISSTDFVDYMDDDTLGFGPTSTCIITKDWIQTFSGNVVKYEQMDEEENVAIIECVKAREAILFKQNGDKHLDLNVWTDANSVKAKYVSKDKIHVDISGHDLNFGEFVTTADKKLKTYYVAKDVIYVKGSFMKIYYNTEFIEIEVYSLYNDRICGLCNS